MKADQEGDVGELGGYMLETLEKEEKKRIKAECGCKTIRASKEWLHS